jgi:hypothetical protein
MFKYKFMLPVCPLVAALEWKSAAPVPPKAVTMPAPTFPQAADTPSFWRLHELFPVVGLLDQYDATGTFLRSHLFCQVASKFSIKGVGV